MRLLRFREKMFYLAHQQFLTAIADPNRALLLLTSAVPLICLEFVRPGAVFPGVCGAVLVILGLHSLALLPLGTLGIVLTAGGLCLLALEGKFSKRWVCLAAGAVALFTGLLNVMAPGAPEVLPGVALVLTVVLAIISGFILPRAYLARRKKRTMYTMNDKQSQSGYAMAGIQ